MEKFKKLGITPNQHKMLEFLRGYIKKNGYSPTYREIMIGVGLKTVSAVHRLLKQLQSRGRVVIIAARARSVFLNEDNAPQPPPLGEDATNPSARRNL